MRVLVTGVDGFIGRHVALALAAVPQVTCVGLRRSSAPAEVHRALESATSIIHLAGANRPAQASEFEVVNAEVPRQLTRILSSEGRAVPVVVASSTQSGNGSLYGDSKRAGEEAWEAYAAATGARIDLFRLPNVFGKWCRPNYNSAVATFAHNIAHDLPVRVDDANTVLTLAYIDDVSRALVMAAIRSGDGEGGVHLRDVHPTYQRSLGEIVTLLNSFRASRTDLRAPEVSDPFVHALYATYLSHLATNDVAYALRVFSDARGSLAELLKSRQFGQIFVSRTVPGATRGNHYHHSKTEKFVVLEGSARIRFRSVADNSEFAVDVEGRQFRVVDIPPGYAHSICNIGEGELVTLFWASEIFDANAPDTFAMEA